MIAPVLPGETMRNLLLQSRVVSNPIANPLIGWWLEHYFFYVNFRHLDARDTLQAMVLDPDANLSSMNEAANAQYSHGWNTVPWTKLCLKRVVEEYFRAPDEAWDAYTINGLPSASINRNSLLDSAVNDAAFAGKTADEDLVIGGDGKFTMSELEELYAKYEWQRDNGLIYQDLTYDDWLREQGVSVPEEIDEQDREKPELIRYIKSWSYPTNTVDPTSGAASSALSWVIQERADKDRFFREPGFVIGVQVVRPKVYLRNQSGSGVGLMTDAKSWLPYQLEEQALSAFKSQAATSGLLPSNTTAYWIDLRDLLMYGDQFTNWSITATADKNVVALPTAGLQKRYPNSVDADNMFKVKTAGLGKIDSDGVVTMMIASRQRDRSATV